MAEVHDKPLKGRKFLHISAAYGTKGQRGDSFFHRMSSKESDPPPPPPLNLAAETYPAKFCFSKPRT